MSHESLRSNISFLIHL